MPLPLRKVQPTHVARGTLPERFRIQNDLEAVANGTLANVIMQLSSLSHHAEELFGNLIRVESDIATRANNLQARIDRLAVKVVQLDNSQEELGSMQEALNTKAFQSSMSFDQQVVSRQSMPAAMNKTYLVCDKPPPLDKLNSYRDDGKDGLKFYTDPNYFFDLWRQEMLKDTDKVVKKPHKGKQDGGQKHKKRVRPPQNTRDRYRQIVIEQGEHIMQGQQYVRQATNVTEVADGVIIPPDDSSINGRRQILRPSSIELEKANAAGHPESQSPYGNGMDPNAGGDYRSNHLLQHHSSSMLNRNISQSQYDYEAYNSQIHNHSQQRYYLHSTPPPPYSDHTSMSSPSPNAYSISSRFSGSGIAANSTPRNGTISINVTPNSNSMANGYAFRPQQPPPAPPPNYVGTPPSALSGNGTPTRNTRMMNSRETLPPPPPPPSDSEPIHYNGMHNGNSMMPPPPPISEDDNDDPLPPPPPPPDSGHHFGMSVENLAPSPELAPPPPPPLPMPDALNNGTAEKNTVVSNGGLVKKPKEKRIIPAPFDGRSELLKAIRNGIELRKVETKKEPNKEDKTGGTYCDVASILARRVAVEMSDSESGSDSEYDSDQWDEASA